MIFSQVLFIIYAMFLPVSFILSMIPSFDGMSKRAITKLFNTILTRAGITLIITTAFSISTMLYTLSAGYPFFLIAFLQIVTFAGIYFKLGDLMSMFSLQSNDSQSVGSRVMRKPRMLMHAHMHRLQRKLGRSMTTLGAGSAIVTGKKGQSGSGSSARTQADHSRPDGKEKSTLGKRIGQTIGTVADTKDRMVDTASGLKEQVKDLPTNARYAVYQGKSKVKENVRDLTSSISQTKADRASGRKEQQEQRRKTIAKRRSEMEQVKQKKQPASSVHNIMMNRPQNSLIFRLHIRNLNKPNKSVQQLSPIFQVQKWNAKAIPFKKKPFKSQQLQPLQQIELHNVQSQKNVRLLFKEYHYKIQEVDHQSKPPPLRKSVRNHEVENFSDWWFWIILDGLLTASVCCHFIFR